MTGHARRWFLGLILARLVLLATAAALAVAAVVVSAGLFLVAAVAAGLAEFGLAKVCRRLG